MKSECVRRCKLLALRTRLAALRAECLYYLHECHDPAKAVRDSAFFRFCGIPRVVGAPVSGELCEYRSVAGERESECERLARALAVLGPVDLGARANWYLGLSAAERAAGQALLADLAGRPAIAINMGGKAVINDWGQENWRALIGRLAARHGDLALFAVGAEQDDARAREVGALWPGPFLSLCGRATPRVSAAALERATLFVGHDSGPMHLAAAMGVSCVAFFGNNNPPRIWHPCFGHHRVIHDMRGIGHISVDAAAATVVGMLQEKLAAMAAEKVAP